MKTKSFLLLVLVNILFITFLSAQKWEKSQPNQLYAVDKKNSIDSVKVGIGTETPQFPLEVKGVAKVDSMIISGGVHIFGPLHIGSNSLTIGTEYHNGPDEITSDQGIINLGGDYNTTYLNFSQIKVGIGTQQPFLFDATGNLRGLEVTGDINITNANC